MDTPRRRTLLCNGHSVTRGIRMSSPLKCTLNDPLPPFLSSRPVGLALRAAPTVAALYERRLFAESMKYRRSQTAATVNSGRGRFRTVVFLVAVILAACSCSRSTSSAPSADTLQAASKPDSPIQKLELTYDKPVVGAKVRAAV